MPINQGGFAFDAYFAFDGQFARDRFFGTDRMLQTKIRINEQFRTNPRTIVEHTVDCLELAGNERVLDMGCGVGYTLAGILDILITGSALGFDISPALLEVARQRINSVGLTADLEVRDASYLEDLPSNSFDRIVANFMIHYVADISATLEQVGRILEENGLFVLSTDSTTTMGEMYQVHFESMRDLGFPESLFRASPKARMSLENGAEKLGRVFRNVRLVRYEDVLEFPDCEPFMEFYRIGHKFCCASAVESGDVPQERLEQLASVVEGRVRAKIREDGYFRITKHAGSFICTAPK